MPLDILKQYWGFTAFREPQQEIIESVLAGTDTLALLPTGGGKSVCFQVPGLLLEGLTIVITPLIALMKDQVEQLKKKGIKAAAIYSGMPMREIDVLLDNCIYGNQKFLYVSPERLKSTLFQERVSQMNISLLAVDEAHCISQWGYDFRPSYLEISTFRALIPETKIIALTATATPAVTQDIIDNLQLDKPKIFTKSFARKNLSYSVRNAEHKQTKLLEILQKVAGSAIVYVRNRGTAKQISDYLSTRGISSDYYHAGLTNKVRDQVQASWLSDKTRVIVATNAFGMGIDKGNVRLVIHMDLPDSLEAYYQEAGRAGRDQHLAFGVIVLHPSDPESLLKKAIQAYPSPDYLKRIYQSLANYYKIAVGSSLLESYDFELEAFAKTYSFNPFEAFIAIKKLGEEGLVQLNDSFFKPSKVMISLDHKDLYKFQVANIKYDGLIKSLLRLYGGELYQEFVTVSEYNLSQISGISVAEVSQRLKALDQSNVLIYDYQKEKPQLTFLTPRQDANQLKINAKRLEERKGISLDKVKQIIQYVTSKEQCRTQILQHYFGEVSFVTCGNCDNCIERKKALKQNPSLQEIIRTVQEILDKNILHFQDLKDQLMLNDEHMFGEVLREMVDHGQIRIHSSGNIELA